MNPALTRRSDVSRATVLAPMRSALLSRYSGLRHGITQRVVGVGLAAGNIGYSPPRDVDDAWRMRQQWCAAIDVPPGSLVVGRQVHGAETMVVKKDDAGRGASPRSDAMPPCDALLTADPGVTLMTLHADCLPVLVYDPVLGVVAAVHAGWRGTVLGILPRTVSALQSEFGSRPDTLVAFLGPAICRSCYQVGEEVIDAWTAFAGPTSHGVVHREDDGFTFDLSAANVHLLVSAGLPMRQIESCQRCTRCDAGRWFSHRGQGPNTGRFGAMIALGEGRT